MKLKKKLVRAMKRPLVKKAAMLGLAVVVLDNIPDLIRYLRMERM